MVQTLLLTKLHRPPVPTGLIERPLLFEQLNRGVTQPLTLVVASAGFGKSTLVGSWIDRMAAGAFAPGVTFPAAWLSLDEEDSDLNIFLSYVVTAVRTIFPDACEETMQLINAGQPPPLQVIYTTFSNELEQLPGSFILVLDDYHTIQGAEVHDLLAKLVQHWPKPLHLVLISRINPSIPLAYLKAKAMVGEIRTQDLRFTHEETAAYLKQVRSIHLRQASLDVLEQRYEGWIAGLHLAVISLRSTDNQEDILLGLSGEDSNITEYLMDEVVSRQLMVIRTFLLKTSILERFCASLCEAILDVIDPAWDVHACLDWIERAELFIIPLDTRREWFRFHHLFQELLHKRLISEMAPGDIKDLHLRASAWFEAQGLVDEALHHALAAGDLNLAARLIDAGLCDALNREDRPTLERWLRLLPEEMIQQDPGLLMIKAWALQFMWRLDQQAKVLQQVEELLDAGAGASLPTRDLQILRGQIQLITAQYTYFSNQTTRTIELCREVLAVMPTSWTFVRGSAMLYLGLSMQANGQAREAERLLLDEYESSVDRTNVYPLILLQTLGFIYLLSGQLDNCLKTGLLMIQGSIRSGNTFTRNWGDYYVGVASYLGNDLETANQHFTKILNDRYLAHIGAYRDAIVGLALIHQIKGESTKARQMLELISQYDLEQSGREDEHTLSLRARMMLLQGDQEAAHRWVDTFSAPPPDQAIIFHEEPQVTRVRVLLASNTDADRNLALQVMDILDEILERTHNIRYQIEILALRALALNAQGKTGEARNALKKALDLARPGGFLRVFADLGKPMQDMLLLLMKHGYAVEAIRHLLSAFPQDDQIPAISKRPVQQGHPRSPTIPALAEPLTPRELDILILLRQPLSNKEIALKLHISYQTVKRHISNIYSKLGVNRRWDAVARAQELGILPPG